MSTQVLQPGTIIDGKYELIAPIGLGGFARIYKAWHKQFERHVAIKFLDDEIMHEPDGLPRFEQEARALSTLRHVNIVAFYGYGLWQGAPYMVMELVEGTSLAQKLRQEAALSLPECGTMFEQICNGLQCAHQHGFIHRDLKPSNIMITTGPDGKPIPKIIDFGLAKSIQAQLDGDQRLTTAGCAVGSSHYMPPEQCYGEPVDHRADIYALGCILHECLTGTPPFLGDDAVAVMYQHANCEPPALKLNLPPDTVAALDGLIARAMAKAPDDRFKNAQEFAHTLRGITSGAKLGPVSSWSARRLKISRGVRIGAAVLLAIGLGAVTAYSLTNSPEPGPADLASQRTSLELWNDYNRHNASCAPKRRLMLAMSALRQNDKDHLLDKKRICHLYRALATAYRDVNEIAGCEQAQKMVEKYRTTNCASDPYYCQDIILRADTYRRKNDSITAEKELKSLLSEPGLRNIDRGQLYHALTSIYLSERKFDLAWDSVLEGRRYAGAGNTIADELTFQAALVALMRNDPESASELAAEGLTAKLEHNPARFQIMSIRAALAKHDIKQADRLANTVRCQNFIADGQPNYNGYMVLIAAAASNGKQEEARRLARLAEQFGDILVETPQTTAFDSLMVMRALRKAGMRDLEMELAKHFHWNEQVYENDLKPEA